jgi:hypothetical protein
MTKFSLVLTALAVVLACTTAPSGVKEDPSYSTDVQPLFNASCVGCHSGVSPSAGYDLSSRDGVLGRGTDTVPNVIPDQPDSSELHRRLDAGTMPPAGPWDSAKVQTVRNWVARGAKDN